MVKTDCVQMCTYKALAQLATVQNLVEKDYPKYKFIKRLPIYDMQGTIYSMSCNNSYSHIYVLSVCL